MPVPTTLRGISATAGSNNPAGSEVIGSSLDDYLRAIQAVFRQYLASQASNIASASTTDLSTADGFYAAITGTTTINSFGTEGAGIHYLLKFNGALQLNQSSAIQLPGAATFTTAAGDMAWVVSEGSGNWRMPFYMAKAGGIIGTTQTLAHLGPLDLSAAGAGQIVFPATQNASAGANTLDDYEEGTWTPTIAGATTPGTQTYTRQTGRYTKIGRLVTIEFDIQMSAKDAATNGNLTVAGLPFAVNSAVANGAIATGQIGSITLSGGYTQITIVPSGGTSTLLIEQAGSGVAANILTQAALAAASGISGSGVYSV